MSFATYPYSKEIREMFASMEEFDRITELARARGQRVNFDIYRAWLGKSEYTKEHIEKTINDLCKDIEFQKLVLARHKREMNCDVSWNYYIENAVSTLVEFVHKEYRSWQCLFLCYVYNWYKNERKQKYPAYYANNPLERYYRSKGIELNLSSNYGLVDVADFEIKYLNGPKLYDKRFDTHLFVKFITPELLQFIAEARQKAPFKLALRPDYEICGDGIQDIAPILEALIKGSKEPLEIDMMPILSWLCDDLTSSDWLIVLHNKETREITFEEMVGEPEVEDDYIVSQVVHFIYTKEKGSFYINHLDHEFVFYTSEQHTRKLADLTTKGEARARYKTFKIDDARIPYDSKCSNNIIYMTLDTYFENKDLLKEYFDEMIEQQMERVRRMAGL